MDYFFHILILVAIYSILSLSLNLLLGYLGISSVAHAALFGVGAYTYALAATLWHIPPVLSLLISCGSTTLLGFLLALPALRLRDDYLVLATFGFAIAAYDLFNNLIDITQGPMGISGIPRLSLFLSEPMGIRSYFFLCLVFAAMTFLSIKKLVTSPWGRTLLAIREKQEVVTLCGKNIAPYKIITFGFSALWTGVAGSLYAGYLSFIAPANFVPMLSILILCMVVIGGPGSFGGSILGALIFIAVPEMLRFLQVSAVLTGTLNQLLFSLALIILMLFRPQGLLGKFRITNE